MHIDKNCLSYWFPLLEQGAIPVPRTHIIKTLLRLEDLQDEHGQDIDAEYDEFIAKIRAKADLLGYPCFLRTGQCSAKHNWRDSCYIEDPDQLGYHIWNIVEYSMCAGMFGLRTNVWAVREFLPLNVAFTLPGYEGMPVAKEYRFFIKGGNIECWHDYWPLKAIEQGKPADLDWQAQYDDFLRTEKFDRVLSVAENVAYLFRDDGEWSVDLCQHQDGRWFVTDMALAEQSYHCPACPNCPEEMRERLQQQEKPGLTEEECAAMLAPREVMDD